MQQRERVVGGKTSFELSLGQVCYVRTPVPSALLQGRESLSLAARLLVFYFMMTLMVVNVKLYWRMEPGLFNYFKPLSDSPFCTYWTYTLLLRTVCTAVLLVIEEKAGKFRNGQSPRYPSGSLK